MKTIYFKKGNDLTHYAEGESKTILESIFEKSAFKLFETDRIFRIILKLGYNLKIIK